MILKKEYKLRDNRMLINALKGGDIHCFEAFYHFYYRALCLYATRWVPLSTAEDIVQDTMIHIWENRATLLEELSLEGYVFKIVRNKALDRISHRNVCTRIHLLLEKKFEEQFDSPDFYLETEITRLYNRALDCLPEQTRNIFKMSRTEGMTHQQIAARMNVSLQTVNYHICQALKSLGIALKDYLILIVGVFFAT